MQRGISNEDEDGSQDEGQKKLHVDEVTSAVQLPGGGWDGKRFKENMRPIKPIKHSMHHVNKNVFKSVWYVEFF